MFDDDDRRITPYEDLFDAISENKRIEVGLHSVIAMGEKCDPAIREMAQAVLEEIEFFRQRKRGVVFMSFNSHQGSVLEKNPEQAIQVENTGQKTCDPIVLEMARAVMEEMEYVRRSRERQRRCGYIFIPFFIIFFLLVVSTIIFGISQIFRHAS